ncbi:hypothetical protein ACFLWN_01580 [Chloroflexota bacterium]
MVTAVAPGCTLPHDFDSKLQAITGPYRFSIFKWEFSAFAEEIRDVFRSSDKDADDSTEVIAYFAAAGRIKKLQAEIDAINNGTAPGNAAILIAEREKLAQQNISCKKTVEKIMERQLRETLSEQGIYYPLYRYFRFRVHFPPVNFHFDEPPNLLVISPRDRIESIREITLQQNMSLEEMASIESSIDEMDVSSLVVTLGGFAGTYPSFVTSNADLRFTLDIAAEEWLHQYLAFRPLGFRYLLDVTGIARNYEIATMNETVASIVGKEIGAAVWQRYYSPSLENNQVEQNESSFDFNQEMQDIRRTVDTYLAQGEITQAEEFMVEKQQHLTAHSYYLRKLNQAYFAFYGTYADRPTSISPIGAELRELRTKSESLSQFLDTVAVLTSRQDLEERLRQ